MPPRKIDPATGLPPTKLSIIQGLMDAGAWEGALRAAARLPVLGAQRGAILTAHGALTNPGFYRQIGKDPTRLVEAGVTALKERFDNMGKTTK